MEHGKSMNDLRKELYQLVREQESVFDFFQFGAVGGLWYVDANNTEQAWISDSFWRELGYHPDAARKQQISWQQCVFSEDQAVMLEYMKACGESATAECRQVIRFWHKDGSTVQMKCRGMAAKDHGDITTRILIAHINITAEATLEKERKSHSDSYKSIVENQSYYIIEMDIDGQYTFVNDYYCKDHQWNIESIMGHSSLLAIIPEDIPKWTDLAEKCFSNPGEHFHGVITRELADGTQKTAAWDIMAIPTPASDSLKLLCIGKDITDKIYCQKKLEASEDRFRFIAENTSDGIMFIERGNVVYVSPAYERLSGYSQEEEKRHTLEDNLGLIHPEDRERIRVTLAKHIAHQDAHFKYRFRSLHKQGHYIWREDHLSVTYDQKGNRARTVLVTRDITEEYTTQEALKIQQQYLNSLLDNTAEGIYGLDLDGNCTFCNTACLKLLDYEKEEELMGKNMHRLIHHSHGNGEIYPIDDCNIYKAFKLGVPSHVESEVLWRKDGSCFAAEIWSHPIHSEGAVVGAVVSFLNIDKRKAAEKQVEDKNRELDYILQASNIGVWKLDVSNNKFHWDANLIKIIEREEDGFEHGSMEEIIYSEDRALVAEAFNSFMNSEDKGYSVEYRVQLPKSGQERIHYTQGVKFFDGSGKLVQVIGITQDITDVRKADQEIRYLQEIQEQAGKIANIGSWEVDLVKNTVTWSAVTAAIHEVPEGFIPVFEEGIKFYKEGYSQDRIKEVFARCATEGVSYDEELKIVTYKGNERWVRVIGVAEVAGLQVTRIRGSFQDITQEKNIKKDLRVAKQKAEEASMAKSDFLANMSHEIRTPLNSVIGFADLLLKTDLNYTQLEYAQYINRSGSSLLDLINDILDFSKIEAGKLELSLTEVDLWEMGQQLVDIIRYKSNEKGLELLLNISPKVPRYIIADAIRLRQVLTNLLGNAIKFTETGYVKIEVLLEQAYSDNSYELLFAIEDSGIGIPKGKQAAIFEAFSQEDASITRKFGGTGLGLSISNSLLQLMGSSLELESREKAGSRFFFKVRLEGHQAGNAEMVEVEAVLKGIKQVLIVDDNQDTRQILSDMLDMQAIPYRTAEDGFEALELLASQEFDMAIVDYEMPAINGVETIRQIREDLYLGAASLQVILLHSLADDQALIDECRELAVGRFASKPATVLQIFKLLAEVATAEVMPAQEEFSDREEEMLSNGAYTILVVDDNPINMILAHTIVLNILPKANIEEATDGEEAVEVFFRVNPDLVLMDVQMPKMSGYEATKQIRSRESGVRTPVLALTAGIVKGERERCLEAGMDAYLSKPIIHAQVKEAFQTWLPINFEQQEESTEVQGDSDQLRHFNSTLLENRLGEGNQGMIMDILSLIREGMLLSLITQAQGGIDTNQLSAVRYVAHSIKGASNSACLERLAALGAELEQMEPFDIGKAQEIVVSMRQEHECVLEEISQYIN